MPRRTASQETAVATLEPPSDVTRPHQQLIAAAVEICRKRHHEPHPGAHDVVVAQLFTADEWTVFDAVNWDKARVGEEVGRQRKIAKFQQRAETSEDREAAAQALIDATQQLATRGVDISEQIRLLQAELDALQAAERSAADRVQRQQEGLRALRLCVDERTQWAHKQRMRDEVGPLDAELTNLRHERERVLSLQRIEPGGLSARHEIAQLHPDAYDEKAGSVRHHIWQAFVAEQVAELPKLDAKIRELQQQRAVAAREVDALLDVYAR